MSHDEAIELLPWLLNGTLDAGEHKLVAEHADHCVICRRELTQLQRLKATVDEVRRYATGPEPDMRGINARIDAHASGRNAVRRLADRIAHFVANPWRAAFAAQTVLLVSIGAALLLADRPEPAFSTLTFDVGLPPGHYLRVVFDPGMTNADVAELLSESGLTVFFGPTRRGVYTLARKPGEGSNGLDAIQSRLAGDSRVLFVQPVTAGTEQ